ncbi:sigma-54 dependent transcriptional regulator [Bacillus tianshenii]|nr:sigma-54 dependent transcriptional regulator [Bacillus tianshenii]
MEQTILFVEDNDKFRRLTARTLKKEGYVVYEAATGEQAEKLISTQPVHVALLDIMLPDTTGLKLLKKWKEDYPKTTFILCTAYGDIEDAVHAMKLGAFDYLTKPIKADELRQVMQRTFEWRQNHQASEDTSTQVEQTHNLHGMIGKSEEMKNVFKMIERVAPQDVTVLLQGESGTGKSRCANAIHLESNRHNKPFIKVNCAAIPAHLLESELFGYEKGAFTGALQAQKGKCAAADDGTLFLDEIGEIPLDLQAKLLQFTQDKTFTPLGSTAERSVDIRLIAATNRNLWEMVQNGEFREDLYYRLNIVRIELPPLRERKEDLPDIIGQFLQQHETEHQRHYTISEDLRKELIRYEWPGNIRELQNALARATALSATENLQLEDFPEEITSYTGEEDTSTFEYEQITEEDFSLPIHLNSVEKKVIEDSLTYSNGNQAQAAELLGISRQSLLYKVKKHDIDLSQFI